MSNIKVSVIIPVYNVERYLRECLDSVINQSLKDIEIICVEDCSTDNSPLILEEYSKKDSRIKVIQNEENKGLSTVRNIALDQANGEYVAFLDSDDYLDLQAYEKTYNICKDLDLDCLLFKTSTVDDKTGEIIEDVPYFSLDVFKNFNKTIFNHKDTKNFTCRICVQVGSKLIKRELLEKNNIRFPDGLIFEDEPFFYNFYLNAERVSFLKENLYFYRVNRDDSIISKCDDSFRDIVQIFRLIREIIDNNDEEGLYKSIFINRFIPSVLVRFSQSPENLKNEFFLDIQNDFKDFLLCQNKFSLLTNENKLLSLYVLSSEDYNEFSNYMLDKTSSENLLKSSTHFIIDLNENLLDSQRNLNKKEKILIEKIEEINSKNELLNELENKINLLDSEVHEKSVLIGNKDAEISEKLGLINDQSRIIEKNLDIIESKDAIIREKSALVANREAEISEKLNLIDNQKRIIESKDTIIREKSALIDSKDVEINEKSDLLLIKDKKIKQKISIINNKNMNLQIKTDLLKNTENSLNHKKKELLIKNQELNNIQNKNNSLNLQVTNLNNKLSNYENEINSLNLQVTNLNNKLNSYENEINKLIDENQIQKRHISNLLNENEVLKITNEEVFNSNSWKKTEFLRKIGYVLRKFNK